MIEALSSDGSDEPFDDSVLPRRSWRGQHVDGPYGSHSVAAGGKREIAIANQEARRVVPREGLAELLRRPCRSRMRGDGDVDHAPPMVREHDEDEQQPAGGGRDHEEVRRHDLLHMVGQECPPRLCRRPTTSNEVFGDAGFADVDAELQQFTVNSGRAPEGVCQATSSGSNRERQPGPSVDRGGAGSSKSTTVGTHGGARRRPFRAGR